MGGVGIKWGVGPLGEYVFLGYGGMVSLCLPFSLPATQGPLTCVNGTLCADGEACVMDSERCDGFIDCSDHSDEDNCSCEWRATFMSTLKLGRQMKLLLTR